MTATEKIKSQSLIAIFDEIYLVSKSPVNRDHYFHQISFTNMSHFILKSFYQENRSCLSKIFYFAVPEPSVTDDMKTNGHDVITSYRLDNTKSTNNTKMTLYLHNFYYYYYCQYFFFFLEIYVIRKQKSSDQTFLDLEIGGELVRLNVLPHLGEMIFIPRLHGIFYLSSVKKFVMLLEIDYLIKYFLQ